MTGRVSSVTTNWYSQRMLITESVYFVYQSTVTPKRTEQNLGLFGCTGKSEAEVTNHKRLVVFNFFIVLL